MRQVLHILSSAGDCTDPRIWSGTPHNIWKALLRRGIDVRTHNLAGNRPRRVFARVVNLLSGYGWNDPMRVGWGSRHVTARAQAIVDRTGSGDYLHFGSDHMPIDAPAGTRHFLLTDYSVHLLCANPLYQEKTTQLLRDRAMAKEGLMVAQLSRIFTTADYVAESFRREYDLPPEKVVAVKSGLGRINPARPEKDFDSGYMLFVAKRNFVNKGGRLLLDAFEIVRRSRPDARLVVIGNAKDPTQAADLHRMQHTPGIEFHDHDTPRYQELVAGAALYVGPAPDEPWGIIYLESLAVGTPIAGLDRNAFPQFAGGGKYGFVAEEATAAAVADTLLDALSDPTRLAAMGEAGREHVLSEYTWDKVAERIVTGMDRTS